MGSLGGYIFGFSQRLAQSVTFCCRYRSRDQNRDHFGLKNGLETSLVTLGSVTFWSQNGLETGSRPFWSRKWSRDLVSSLSGWQADVSINSKNRAKGWKHTLQNIKMQILPKT